MQMFVEMCSTEEEQRRVTACILKHLKEYAFNPKANYVLIAALNNFHPEQVAKLSSKLLPLTKDLAIH